MRSKQYMTMLDPFQHCYGNLFTTVLLFPALISDILWVACILTALGATISVIVGLSSTVSILVSAAVTIIYTLMGGLYAVAYTDIIQLCFIFISLWICIPFLVVNPVVDLTHTTFLNQSNHRPWLSGLKLEDAGRWTDEMLLLSLGGLAYQSLHQRILSAASSAQAQVTCFGAAGLVFLAGVPSVIIGVVAASTDWNQTAYGLPPPYERGDAGKILPLALQYLTPLWISVLGIGSVAAAVMSSVDSTLLSSASMFTQNIYKNTLRTQASEQELHWTIQISVLLVGLAGTGLAFVGESVLTYWLLSGDLLFCIVFPQLICVVYCSYANTYGAITGFTAGLLLRLLSGEQLLGLPPVILFPGWKEEDGVMSQGFPFRTLAMVVSLLCIPTVSWLTEHGFSQRLLPHSWDVLGIFREKRGVKEDQETRETCVLNTRL